jgi:hypothetical protein
MPAKKQIVKKIFHFAKDEFFEVFEKEPKKKINLNFKSFLH